MKDNKIDNELNVLLKEAERHIFNEYCPSCRQSKICRDSCNIVIKGEPIHYLSARDL